MVSLTMEPPTGLGPVTSSLPKTRSPSELRGLTLQHTASCYASRRLGMVGGGGFEPPKAFRRQIYSLLPLAARASPHAHSRRSLHHVIYINLAIFVKGRKK